MVRIMLLYETRLRTNFSPGNIVFQGDLNTIFHYDIHEFIEALYDLVSM